jgi:hypothetical protein
MFLFFLRCERQRLHHSQFAGQNVLNGKEWHMRCAVIAWLPRAHEIDVNHPHILTIFNVQLFFVSLTNLLKSLSADVPLCILASRICTVHTVGLVSTNICCLNVDSDSHMVMTALMVMLSSNWHSRDFSICQQFHR